MAFSGFLAAEQQIGIPFMDKDYCVTSSSMHAFDTNAYLPSNRRNCIRKAGASPPLQ